MGVVVFEVRKLWVVLEQWLELSDWEELGTVADRGSWVMLDEGLQVKAVGFQGGCVVGGRVYREL